MSEPAKKPTAWQNVVRILQAYGRRIEALETKAGARASRALVAHRIEPNGKLVVTLVDGTEEVVGFVVEGER